MFKNNFKGNMIGSENMGESICGLKRTHYCTEVTVNHVDKEVTVMGWVQKRRDLGKLIFVDLRDRSGIIQIAFGTESKEIFEKAEKIRNEFVLAVRGKVVKRVGNAINPNMVTGEIEILAEELRILSCRNSSYVH